MKFNQLRCLLSLRMRPSVSCCCGTWSATGTTHPPIRF